MSHIPLKHFLLARREFLVTDDLSAAFRIALCDDDRDGNTVVLDDWRINSLVGDGFHYDTIIQHPD